MALSKGFVTTAATTALDGRLLAQGLVIKNVGDVPRAGLLYGSINPVVATSSMNVTVPDQVVLALSRGNNDGVTIVTNVGAATLAIATAPSSNSRYDVVYAKHNDTEKGDANSNPILGVVTGTAAASPQVPAVPVGALQLATVLVPAGVTATNASGVVITNTVLGTALLGSPIRYRTVTEMKNDVTNVNNSTVGYVSGGGQYYARNGFWMRMDGGTFALINQTSPTTIASGTTLGTLGGTNPIYASSDTQFFPVRTDGVIGPLAVTGWYQVEGTVGFTSNSTGVRHLEITQNDASLTPALADHRAASDASNLGVSALVQFQAGDYIKLKGYQTSGSSLNYQSRLTVELRTMS